MPKAEQLISQDQLRELFEYEADTGMLRRRVLTRHNHVRYPWRGIGKNARYLVMSFSSGDTIYLHQAVWLHHHGWIPNQIDHVDGDTRNNRIENLRPCSIGQNQHNSKRKSHNRSGAKGVAFCKGYRKPWRARIIVDKQLIELGRFDTVEEAAAAYAEGAKKYAREFARPDSIYDGADLC